MVSSSSSSEQTAVADLSFRLRTTICAFETTSTSPSRVMGMPAAVVVMVGVVPGTPGAAPYTVAAIIDGAVDVRASWKPTPTLLADDGLVPSLQADIAMAATTAAIPDAVRVRRLVANGRISVIVMTLLEVRQIRTDGKLRPMCRLLRDIKHATATLSVTPLADLPTFTAYGVVRMFLPGWR